MGLSAHLTPAPPVSEGAAVVGAGGKEGAAARVRAASQKPHAPHLPRKVRAGMALPGVVQDRQAPQMAGALAHLPKPLPPLPPVLQGTQAWARWLWRSLWRACGLGQQAALGGAAPR